MPDIKVRVGQQNAVKVVASAFGGSLTAERAQYATNVTGGIASVTALDVTGISTLGGDLYVAGITTLAGQAILKKDAAVERDLIVSGVSTFTGLTTTGGDLYVGGDLYIKDDLTFDEFTARNINVTGVSTFNDDVKFNGASSGMLWDYSTSDLILYDDTRLEFGSNKDFEIWHGGSHTFLKNSGGDLRIRGDKILLKREDGSETYLEANVNQDVKLFYNGDETFATISAGATVTGDFYVSGDLNVIGDLVYDEVTGRNLSITGLSTFVGITTQQSTLFATQVSVAGVTTFNGDVNFPGAAYNIHWDQPTSKIKFDDSAQCVWGSASGGDLRIWHAGGSPGTSNIKNESGPLQIASNDLRLQTQNNSEDYLLAVDGGSVSIFHNDVKRLETTASGVDITNTLNVAGVSTFVGDAQFDGNVSIGGTLTYEDVTNIDSVGLITARSGVRITDGGLVVTAGVSTFAGTIDANGNLNVPTIYVEDNIRHKGDTDTYIEFTGDQIRIIAGGKPLIHAEEGTIDTVIINDGSNDLDFRVEGQNDEYQIFSDGSTDRVGIGSAIPSAKLDVAGDFNVSGVVTATQLTGLIDGGTY